MRTEEEAMKALAAAKAHAITVVGTLVQDTEGTLPDVQQELLDKIDAETLDDLKGRVDGLGQMLEGAIEQTALGIFAAAAISKMVNAAALALERKSSTQH